MFGRKIYYIWKNPDGRNDYLHGHHQAKGNKDDHVNLWNEGIRKATRKRNLEEDTAYEIETWRLAMDATMLHEVWTYVDGTKLLYYNVYKVDFNTEQYTIQHTMDLHLVLQYTDGTTHWFNNGTVSLLMCLPTHFIQP
ncbi:hypothetical protein FQA39_LY14764 [Lamprigera yunnana]|nr:hypothetical protein FQA39_LY14764 [Lamprigera yunnana]